MRIEYFGHASFLLETENKVKIVTDPYESGAFDGSVKYDPIKVDADIVTVSHAHADHNFVSGFASAEILDKEGNYRIKDINITGIKSYHDELNGAHRGENIIFMIETEGVKLVHLGDLGTTDIDFSILGDDVNVLFVPVGGVFTIDADGAKHIVERLSPNIVIPMHFKTEKIGFAIAEVDKFLQKVVDKKIIKDRDSLVITKETLPQDTQVVVLNHIC